MKRNSLGLCAALLAGALLGLFLGVAARAGDGDAGCECEFLGCGGACGPQWYVQADALLMWRGGGAANQPLVIDILNPGGPALLTTSDVAPGLAAGPRLFLERPTDCCHAWQIGYFGLLGGSESKTVFGDDNLAIPGALGLASLDYFDADAITATYRTQLHSFEVNKVRRLDNWSLLAGFRYLFLGESFDITSTDLDTGTSTYHTAANNNLYGLQLGASRVGVLGPLDWSITGKAGVYANSASQHQVVPDFPQGYFLRAATGASGTDLAFVGELNFIVSRRLFDNWSIRGGYNMLWLDGVALAANQLDFADPATSGSALSSGGTLFLHGVSVGVEARW